MSYVTWDIETTVGTQFKRKATPFNGVNWVVTHGWKRAGDIVREHRFGRRSAMGPGWFKPMLANTALLIGMNIKFDLLHAIQDKDNYEAWMDFVVKGGKVWDIQLAEYLLEGMAPEHHMLSLDEIAPRYGGNVKVDEVKKLWEAGFDTDAIDPDLLTRYLIGGKDEVGVFQMGDVENTEMVALKQIARAREVGQLNSILLNMGALMFTVEAEKNGMYVDKELGLRIAATLAEKIEELKGKLDTHLPAFPPEFTWNWSSRKQLSALIFGGTVRYDGTHYVHEDGTSTLIADWWAEFPHTRKSLTYYQKDEEHIVLANGKTMARLLWEHLRNVPDGTDTEPVRYKSGKNADEPKTKRVKGPDLDRGPKTRKGDAFMGFARMTEPKKEWESDAEPGVYSTASEIIEELGSRNIPFLKDLAKLALFTKDLGTYYIVVDEDGKEKGMLSLVGPDGIVHHKLNMTSTVTARLSSSDPNLQNLPKADDSNADQSIVKTIFISRFKGGKIIQSDFTSLEVYIQAILTGSKNLIADLIAGTDMHVMRVSVAEKVSYEEALLKAKGDKKAGIEPIREWKNKRQDAKVFSFQRAYGAGVAKIATTTGMSTEDVEAFVLAENERYPEVEVYYENLTALIKANRKPTNRFVPHPALRGQNVQIGRSSFRAPDGKLYSYSESPSPEFLAKRGTLVSFSPTEIKNYIVQGGGGEWAKAAMYLSLLEFYRRRNFGGLALLVNQVHDAIYADADPTVEFEAAAVLHAAMEAASDYMEYTFNWPIPVPVPTETESGPSMAVGASLPGLKERAAILRKEIRSVHMKGYVPTYLRKGI